MPTDAITGAILGCAIGDALGLPYEGISPRRAARLLGEPTRFRFLFGYGMVSDDTDHTCFVAHAYARHPNDPQAFARALAWHMRWWLLSLPAGIGRATLRAIVRLWLGWSPSRSGVASAGNGPAMRSAVLGAAIDDLTKLRAYVQASTVLTHRDAKAFDGAWAVAFAAWYARQPPSDFFEAWRTQGEAWVQPEFCELMQRVEASLKTGESSAAFAETIGCGQGVSGYVYHTVPMVLHAWQRHPHDYRKAVMELIRLGGDADTTAAIVGAIVGSSGAELPSEWVSRLIEWPRSVRWMHSLAAAIVERRTPPSWPVFVSLPRNLVFLAVVLLHVLRRLLPPY